MILIDRGILPTKEQFDIAWNTYLPSRFYLEFNDSRVGPCSLPRDQVYEELKAAHIDWSQCTSGAMEAFYWMSHILTILKISWK